MAITKVSDAKTWETDVIGSSIPVFVDFWAEWCGPCKMIGPIIQEIAGEYAGRIKVGKMNVDNNPVIPPQYGIRSIPSLLIFKDGTVSDQIVGAVPKNNITEVLDKVLAH